MFDHRERTMIFFFFIRMSLERKKVHFYETVEKTVGACNARKRWKRFLAVFPLSFPNVSFRDRDFVAWVYLCEDRLKFEDSINFFESAKRSVFTSKIETINGKRGKEKETWKKNQSEIVCFRRWLFVDKNITYKRTTWRRFRTDFYYEFTWLIHVLSPQNKLSNIIDR